MTAQDGSGKVATCRVTVVKKALKLKTMSVAPKTSAKKPKVLGVGKTLQFKLSLSPKKATGIIPTHKSNKPKIASVDALGRITALAKGKATITVKAGGKSIKVNIAVK